MQKMNEKIKRGTLSNALSEARASLVYPSRPFTPLDSRKSNLHGMDNHLESPNLQLHSELPCSPVSARTGSFKREQWHSLLERRYNRENGDHSGSLSPDNISPTFIKDSENQASSEVCVVAQQQVDDMHKIIQFLKNENALNLEIDDLKAQLNAIGVFIARADPNVTVDLLEQLHQIILLVEVKEAIQLSKIAIQLILTCSQNSEFVFNYPNVENLLLRLCANLFNYSTQTANDEIFYDSQIVEAILPMLVTTPRTAASSKCKPNDVDYIPRTISIAGGSLQHPLDVLIYVTGLLKNISNDTAIQQVMAKQGAISFLGDLLNLPCIIDVENSIPHQSSSLGQILVQITGIFRNLAVNKKNHKQFWACGIVEALCSLLKVYFSHKDLMLNISRVLSKLTMHETGRANVNKSPENIRLLLDIVNPPDLSCHPLAIRIYFILGNLTSGNDSNRRLIAFSYNCLPCLLNAMEEYVSMYENPTSLETVNEEATKETISSDNVNSHMQIVDVLVKLVRLLANLAINPLVGPSISSTNNIRVLLPLLKKSVEYGDEELMLNTVSFITNLSYHMEDSDATSNWVMRNRVEIANSLVPVLLHENEEAVIESSRAFGNFSRFQDIKDFMAKLQLIELFSVLLDHSNREIVFTVCGILMNIAKHLEIRSLLLKDDINIIAKLISVVRSAGLQDISVATMACKVLYNILYKVSPEMNHSSVSRSIQFLSTTLEELINAVDDESEESYEQFANVANALSQCIRPQSSTTVTP